MIGVTVLIVKNAKTKYTLERVGVDTFKAEVEKRANVQFAAAKDFEFTGRGDRYGWVEGVDGNYHLTCFIENGRILDYPGKTLKSGCKAIAEIHSGEFRMTANQNLVIAGVTPELKDQIDTLAKANGLMPLVSNQRKDSMACVSLPTCPLAMAEAERYLPDAVTEIESMLTKHGIPDEEYYLSCYGLSEWLWSCDVGRSRLSR